LVENMQGRVIVGGLGGGGDVGGALVLATHLKKMGINPVIASFVRCSLKTVLNVEYIAGALVKVLPHSRRLRGRFFEPLVVRQGYEVYAICVEEEREKIMEGIKHLVNTKGARVWIATDLGGDSLLKGDEPHLGSYTTDMLAEASLASASDQLSIKTYLAVGALGMEGGGEMDQANLASRLLELERGGHYLGQYYPPADVKWDALDAISTLLDSIGSGMLTIFMEALAGVRGKTRIDSAWLHKEVIIKRWHANLFFFDLGGVCETSYLCSEAKKGWLVGLKSWVRKRRVRHKEASLNEVVKEMLEKKVDLERLVISGL